MFFFYLEVKRINVSISSYLCQGRLNELMSQIRMQNHLAGTRADVSYQMDPSLQQEIKHVSLDPPCSWSEHVE